MQIILMKQQSTTLDRVGVNRKIEEACCMEGKEEEEEEGEANFTFVYTQACWICKLAH